METFTSHDEMGRLVEIEALIFRTVIGNAHATFARALLKCYDPTIPKIGPGQKLAQHKLDVSLRFFDFYQISLSRQN